MLARLFADGGVVYLMLAFMTAELIALILIRKRVATRLRPLELAAGLSGGAALALALREALRGAAWPSVAPWLVVALIGHLWDLHFRLAKRRTE